MSLRKGLGKASHEVFALSSSKCHVPPPPALQGPRRRALGHKDGQSHHSFFNEVAYLQHGKKWFCYGNKIGDNKGFFDASTKKLAAATKRFVDRPKHFAVVTKYFCYPYFNK